MIVSGMLGLAACSEKDLDNYEPAGTQAFNYQAWAFSGGLDSYYYLDSLKTQVASAVSSEKWITATPTTDETGTPCVMLRIDEMEGNEERKGTLTATDESGNTAIVNVVQYPGSRSDFDSGANSNKWLNEWPKVETIKVIGMENEVNTPWYYPETSAHLLITHLTKEQGWEMAFSYLNDKGAPNRRYFALYNKYLGILRVFNYIPTGQVPTGHPYYQVLYGNTIWSAQSTYYPYYNSLGYSIPTDKATTALNFHVNLTGMDKSTFSNMITPYTQNSSKAATVGWNVFDINMSGFVPENARWRNDKNDGSILNIRLLNLSEASMDLEGLFSGKLNGTFTNPDIQKYGGGNTSDGICSVLSTIGNLLTKGAGAGPGTYARNIMSYNSFMKEGGQATTWNRLMTHTKTYCGYASIGLSVANSVLKFMGKDMPEYYDTIPGKINLTLNGTLKLSGKIEQWAANNDGGVDVRKKALYASNINSSMGDGVVSLATSPVICVAKEDLMSEVDEILLSPKGDNYYSPELSKAGLRMIAFLDPESIKLNLNTEIFDDLGGVKSVTVTPTWGVIPASNSGSTDAMRQAITLGERPTIDMTKAKNGAMLVLTTNSTPRLHKINAVDIMNTELDEEEIETKDNCTLVQQNGSNAHYYGKLREYADKKIMVQPQIYVPFDASGNLYQAQVPDIVVGVNVVVHVNGEPTADKPFECFQYQLQYVPEIKMVSREELVTYRDRLKELQQLWDVKHQAAGTLENNKAVAVDMPFVCLQKSIDMLEKVTNNNQK